MGREIFTRAPPPPPCAGAQQASDPAVAPGGVPLVYPGHQLAQGPTNSLPVSLPVTQPAAAGSTSAREGAGQHGLPLLSPLGCLQKAELGLPCPGDEASEDLSEIQKLKLRPLQPGAGTPGHVSKRAPFQVSFSVGGQGLASSPETESELGTASEGSPQEGEFSSKECSDTPLLIPTEHYSPGSSSSLSSSQSDSFPQLPLPGAPEACRAVAGGSLRQRLSSEALLGRGPCARDRVEERAGVGVIVREAGGGAGVPLGRLSSEALRRGGPFAGEGEAGGPATLEEAGAREGAREPSGARPGERIRGRTTESEEAVAGPAVGRSQLPHPPLHSPGPPVFERLSLPVGEERPQESPAGGNPGVYPGQPGALLLAGPLVFERLAFGEKEEQPERAAKPRPVASSLREPTIFSEPVPLSAPVAVPAPAPAGVPPPSWALGALNGAGTPWARPGCGFTSNRNRVGPAQDPVRERKESVGTRGVGTGTALAVPAVVGQSQDSVYGNGQERNGTVQKQSATGVSTVLASTPRSAAPSESAPAVSTTVSAAPTVPTMQPAVPMVLTSMPLSPPTTVSISTSISMPMSTSVPASLCTPSAVLPALYMSTSLCMSTSVPTSLYMSPYSTRAISLSPLGPREPRRVARVEIPQSQSQSQPQPQPQPQSQPQSQSQSQSQSHSQSQPQLQPQAQSQLQPQSEPQSPAKGAALHVGFHLNTPVPPKGSTVQQAGPHSPLSQHSTVQPFPSAGLCSTAQYSTAQNSTAQHSTAQYSTLGSLRSAHSCEIPPLCNPTSDISPSLSPLPWPLSPSPPDSGEGSFLARSLGRLSLDHDVVGSWGYEPNASWHPGASWQAARARQGPGALPGGSQAWWGSRAAGARAVHRGLRTSSEEMLLSRGTLLGGPLLRGCKTLEGFHAVLCVSSSEKGTAIKRRIPFAAVHSPSLSSYLYSASIPLAEPSSQAPGTVTSPQAPRTVTSPQQLDTVSSPQALGTVTPAGSGSCKVTPRALGIAVPGAPSGGEGTVEGKARAHERRALARPCTPEAHRGGPGPAGVPGERVRIPNKGQVQVIIVNPEGTPVHTFVCPYDLSDMPPRTKTFVRQRYVRRRDEPWPPSAGAQGPGRGASVGGNVEGHRGGGQRGGGGEEEQKSLLLKERSVDSERRVEIEGSAADERSVGKEGSMQREESKGKEERGRGEGNEVIVCDGPAGSPTGAPAGGPAGGQRTLQRADTARALPKAGGTPAVGPGALEFALHLKFLSLPAPKQPGTPHKLPANSDVGSNSHSDSNSSSNSNRTDKGSHYASGICFRTETAVGSCTAATGPSGSTTGGGGRSGARGAGGGAVRTYLYGDLRALFLLRDSAAGETSKLDVKVESPSNPRFFPLR